MFLGFQNVLICILKETIECKALPNFWVPNKLTAETICTFANDQLVIKLAREGLAVVPRKFKYSTLQIIQYPKTERKSDKHIDVYC